MKIYGVRRGSWKKKSEASKRAEKNKLAKAYVEWRIMNHRWIIICIREESTAAQRRGTPSGAAAPHQAHEDMSTAGGTQMQVSLGPTKSQRGPKVLEKVGEMGVGDRAQDEGVAGILPPLQQSGTRKLQSQWQEELWPARFVPNPSHSYVET